MDRDAVLEDIRQSAFSDELDNIEKEAAARVAMGPRKSTQARAIRGVRGPSSTSKTFKTVADIPRKS